MEVLDKVCLSSSLGDPLLELKTNFLGEWQEADVG